MVSIKNYLVNLAIILMAGMFYFSCKSENKGNNGEQEGDAVTDTIHVKDSARQHSMSQTLNGKIGFSSQWNSGWMDLKSPTDFKKGDSLDIFVGGTAHRVVLRLLSESDDPNSPSGIVGRTHTVNSNGEIQVCLNRDFQSVIQISVHGGESPWDVYPLGSNNGPATLQGVTWLKKADNLN